MDLVIHVLVGIFGLLLILSIFRDALQTVIIPRHGAQHVWLVRFSLYNGWRLWTASARFVSKKERRGYLGFYTSLSLILVIAPWAFGMILGFALLQWAFGSQILVQEGVPNFGTILYMSGVTFLTLGYGDIVPVSPMARFLAVVEAGTGFAFLALVIGYVPVIYQAYSRRETPIPLLSEQAGTPPSTAELLRDLGQDGQVSNIAEFLEQWSTWVADVMETHLSYSMLSYSRSEDDRLSWVASLTLLLDVSALVLVGIEGVPTLPAKVTFAIGQRCAMEIAQTLDITAGQPVADRLPPSELERLQIFLRAAGLRLVAGSSADEKLAELRALYEPYVFAISDRLLLPIPTWLPSAESQDSLRAA